MGINSYTIVNRIEAATAKQYQILGPINLTTGTSVRLSANPFPVTQVEIYGYKSVGANTQPLANTSVCHVSASLSGAPRAIDAIPAGGKLTYAPPGGTRLDLADLWVLGATGDAVFVKYLQ